VNLRKPGYFPKTRVKGKYTGNILLMHAMSPMVAVTRVSPMAAEITPMDTKELYSHRSILLSWPSQGSLDCRGTEKKVQI
jgi:hypothetical protein